MQANEHVALLSIALYIEDIPGFGARDYYAFLCIGSAGVHEVGLSHPP